MFGPQSHPWRVATLTMAGVERVLTLLSMQFCVRLRKMLVVTASYFTYVRLKIHVAINITPFYVYVPVFVPLGMSVFGSLSSLFLLSRGIVYSTADEDMEKMFTCVMCH